MHIVLRNTKYGSDKTYVITTGTGLLTTHFGKAGRLQSFGTEFVGDAGAVDREMGRLLRTKLRRGYEEVTRRNLSLDWLKAGQITADIRPECVDRFREVDRERQGVPLQLGEFAVAYSSAQNAVEVRWIHGHDDANTSLWGVLDDSTRLTGPAGSPAAMVCLALWKAGLSALVRYPGYMLFGPWKDTIPTGTSIDYDQGVGMLFLPQDIRTALDEVSREDDWLGFYDALTGRPTQPALPELMGNGFWARLAQPMQLL